MSGFPYTVEDDGPGPARLGVIVLQADQTIEQDLRRLIPPAAARVNVSRIPSGAELTPETIAGMSAELTRAAALLPDAPFDAIAYACTSGTTLIGADVVAERVCAGRPAAHVTDPLSAALAAAGHLGLRSLALVSPYVASVAEPVCEAFRRHGVAVPLALSFEEKVERRVARIAPASLKAAALHALEVSGADGVFLSCTNLRTLDILDEIEQAAGRPALASNQVLAWHLGRLAGGGVCARGPGALLSAG